MINRALSFFQISDTMYVLLIFAVVGDLIIPFILAPFYKDYNHLTMVMSMLGNQNSPLHFVINLWLVLAGIMFTFGSIRLYTVFAPVSKALSVWLLLSILAFSIGACILSGIFPVGETKELLTTSQKIHGFGSAIGFFLLMSVPLIIAILSFKSNDQFVGIISLLFFVFALLFFSLFVMADKEKYINTIISYEGLWQRLWLLCMYAPIVIVSLKNLIKY